MIAPTVAVTCQAADQNGNPVGGAIFRAKLDQTEIYQGFIVPEVMEVTADVSGVAVLNLWPNELGVAGSLYKITAINPDTGMAFLKTTASVPNVDCNLHEILVQEPYPTIDAAAQALITAQSAALSLTQYNLATWAYTQAFQLVSATRNADSAITSAVIVWPDGVAGVFTADTLSASFPGAVDAWHATYVGDTTQTVTQPTVTRDANGAVTVQPAITIV